MANKAIPAIYSGHIKIMITIPSLPIGNFASVIRMVEKVGGCASLTDSVQDIEHAEKIILVGVGAFDHGMSSLKHGRWIDALNEAVLHRRVPVLGICLGMQLMCNSSEEGQLPGLGWIDAHVKRFNLPSESNLLAQVGNEENSRTMESLSNRELCYYACVGMVVSFSSLSGGI